MWGRFRLLEGERISKGCTTTPLDSRDLFCSIIVISSRIYPGMEGQTDKSQNAPGHLLPPFPLVGRRVGVSRPPRLRPTKFDTRGYRRGGKQGHTPVGWLFAMSRVGNISAIFFPPPECRGALTPKSSGRQSFMFFEKMTLFFVVHFSHGIFHRDAIFG